MNDRTHFFLSCTILVLIVSLALRPQTSAISPQASAQTPDRQHRRSVKNIHQFLDVEEGFATVLIEPAEPESPDQTRAGTGPVHDRQEFIPMNVVPLLGNAKQTTAPADGGIQARKPQITVRKPKATEMTSALSRRLKQIDSNADGLISQSQDAFSRGLMSLSDYQLALNIAYRSKIEVGELRGIKNAAVNQLRAKSELLQSAVDKLQWLNQPASQGWYGDVAHAQLLLAQNEYEIAAASGNEGQKGFALQNINRFTNQYFSVRKAELGVGEADLIEYGRAAKSVFEANLETNDFHGNESHNLANLAEYASRLEGIQKAVEYMGDRGAGMGRKDLVELSQAQAAYLQANYFRHKKEDRLSRKQFEQSSQHARAAWEVRMNTYYPAGTASLHELTSAWILWKSADMELQKSESTSTEKSDRQLTAGLDRMINLTGQIQDRRGRMASDVSLIYCLKDADALSELKQKSE